MVLSRLRARQWVKNLVGTYRIFYEINGDQRAAAFGFYAFFALFPLLLLMGSVGAVFLEGDKVEKVVIDYIQSFLPLQPSDRDSVGNLIQGVLAAKGRIGLLAVIVLTWSGMNFFKALVQAVNRAWHTRELQWWKVPVKNFLMLLTFGSALLVGVLLPAVLNALESLIAWNPALWPFMVQAARLLLPALMLFYGLVVLYKVSPHRRVTFGQVWVEAAAATLLLKLIERILIFYTVNIWQVNALYGAMGTMVILLLWVFLCGVVVIAGACHCAARGGQSELTV